MNANTVIVGPDLLKLLGAQVLGGVMVTGGVAGVLLGLFGLNWLLVAAIGALVVCCCGAMMLAAAIGHRPRVEIGPDGFVVRTVFGSRSRRWSDVEGDFVVIKVGLGKTAAYRVSEACKRSAGIKRPKWLAGNDEGISGAYRVPIGQLAELLNQRKGRAAGSA